MVQNRLEMQKDVLVGYLSVGNKFKLMGRMSTFIAGFTISTYKK